MIVIIGTNCIIIGTITQKNLSSGYLFEKLKATVYADTGFLPVVFSNQKIISLKKNT
jgi:hypothetical protein